MKLNHIKGLGITLTILLCISLLGCYDKNESVDKDSQNFDVNKENSDENNTVKGNTFISELTKPHSVCFDGLGNMFVADGSRLKRISSSKEIEVFADFTERCMTAITDSSNNIYVVTLHKLYKLNQEGEKFLLADGFVTADGLEIDDQGNIYVADAYANIVYKVTPSNEKSIFIDNDLDDIEFDTYYVTGLCFDSNYNNLYTVRHHESIIMKYPIDSTGTAGEGEVYYDLIYYRGPDYIAMDEEGSLYVTVFYDNKLLRIKPDLALDEIEINGSWLDNPTGLAFGKNGFLEDSLYIANFGFGSIDQVDIGKREKKR